MKSIFLFAFVVFIAFGTLTAQNQPSPLIDKIVNASAVESVEKVLSADSLEGRGNFTPGIEKAARFIEGQFKAAGLQTWNGGQNYLQPFSMIKMKLLSVSGVFDDSILNRSTIIPFSSSTHLRVSETSGYEKFPIRAGENFIGKVIEAMQSKK